MERAKDQDPRIRDARATDLPAVQSIYAHHVRFGLASFEEEAPDLAEIERRFRRVIERGLPFLVAELDGEVRGYAYAGPYRSRPAYRYAIEDTVYVAPGFGGRGAGRALLLALIDRCEQLGYRRMVAVIGDRDNLASIRLHEGAGFETSGTLRSVGFKLGRWVDSVLMERPLGEGDATLPDAPLAKREPS
jgi:phosphinothricin acetyltransferase